MATVRAINNASGYNSVPQNITSSGDTMGEVFVSVEQFSMNILSANGDVVLCQVIRPDQRVLSVRVVNDEDVATGVFTVGVSASNEIGLSDTSASVAADPDAFLAGTNTLSAATAEHNMPAGGVAGFLKMYDAPVYLTVTFTTIPTLLDTKKLTIIVTAVGK